jgi:hypothetical protein
MDGDARPSFAKGHTMGERRPSSAAAELDDGGAGTCCAMTALSAAVVGPADLSFLACRYSCCRCWNMKMHNLESCADVHSRYWGTHSILLQSEQMKACLVLENFKLRKHRPSVLLHSNLFGSQILGLYIIKLDHEIDGFL